MNIVVDCGEDARTREELNRLENKGDHREERDEEQHFLEEGGVLLVDAVSVDYPVHEEHHPQDSQHEIFDLSLL